MNGFQYKHGDKPLEGYTIERGVGRGGFGEVYYAISDGGRECAIKAVQGYEQIELRGISQCMNLKSPHLVSIFDIKHNDRGRPFVVMEYVAGPSLRELLEESPSGLGTQKAAFFLREIAKGLTYLHDRGIVHRDLKPGNIFYEDGYVKIGDYGLSKSITPSRHSGQTITVGTVHYMAPEIGQGKYDRSIDIYALGCVLYEMLTGQVPFFGASHGEILMKHLTDTPDFSGIDESFARVIKKAMTKDPAERYQTVQEMVEDVFGEEYIRESVSHFRPESLSMVAKRAAQKVTVGTGSSAEVVNQLGVDAPDRFEGDPWGKFGREMCQWGTCFGGRMGAWGTHIGQRMADTFSGKQRRHEPPAPPEPANVKDRLTGQQRNLLCIVTSVIMGFGAGFLGRDQSGAFGVPVLIAILIISGACKGLSLAHWKLLPKLRHEQGFVQHLSYGGIACVLAGVLSIAGFAFTEEFMRVRHDHRFVNDAFPATALIVGICLFLANWAKRMNPNRKERVSLEDAFSAGMGGLLALLTDASVLYTGGILAGISMATQALSPFNVPDGEPAKPQAGARGERGGPEHEPVRGEPDARTGLRQPLGPGVESRAARRGTYPGSIQLMPGAVRLVFLAAFVLLCGMSLMTFALVRISDPSNNEEVYALTIGASTLLLALFCLVKAVQRTFRRWWSSLVKPMIMCLSLAVVIFAWSILAKTQGLSTDEQMILSALIIFPSIFFLIIAAITNRTVDALTGSIPKPPPLPQLAVSPRRRIWALLLAALGFFPGLAGFHRLYAGKVITGVIWLCTWGLFGIGTFIDMILIATGRFKDEHGRRLLIWHDPAEVRTAPPAATAVARAAAANVGDETGVLPTETIARAQAGQRPTGAVEPELSKSTIARRQTNAAMAFVGGLLITAAFVVGLGSALRGPEMLSAGVFGADVARDLRHDVFGTADWPTLIHKLAVPLVWFLMAVGAVVLMIARRRAGISRMVGTLLGCGLLMLTLFMLNGATRHIPWPDISALLDDNRANWGPAITRAFDAIHQDGMILAAIMFPIAMFILCWPERKEQPLIRDIRREGAER